VLVRNSSNIFLFLRLKPNSMSNPLLKGKKGIIFGALDERSIAWRTALRCFEEGAQLVLTNAPVALRMGEINKPVAMPQ
jgi:enoyl-[acyl-carrier protein] reductase I